MTTLKLKDHRPMTLGLKNRNLLNIRYSEKNPWKGQIGSNKGFAVFEKYCFGYRAAYKILLKYRKRHLRTIQEIVYTWCPDDTAAAYVTYICDKLKCSADFQPTTLYDYTILLHYMSYFESGYSAGTDYILKSIIIR